MRKQRQKETSKGTMQELGWQAPLHFSEARR